MLKSVLVFSGFKGHGGGTLPPRQKGGQGLVQQATAVSLTSDMWTSMNMEAYLAVTCHFIADGVLNTTLLGAHAINLMAKKSLDDTPGLEQLRTSARRIVTHFRSSTTAKVLWLVLHILCFYHHFSLLYHYPVVTVVALSN